MNELRKLGNKGEELAARFLRTKKYKILEKQYRTKFGEIDIIALDKKTIVFVEVKTRRTFSHGYPEEAVDQTKLKHFNSAGEYYLMKQCIESAPHRYDVVAIEMEIGKTPKILHIQDVGYL